MSLALRTMICTDAMMREASRPHNVAVEVVVPTCRPAYDGRHMHMRGQWLRGPPICGQDCSLNYITWQAVPADNRSSSVSIPDHGIFMDTWNYVLT